MRVISGKYRGKIIDGIDIEGMRPTMDRIKESMFAMIQTNLKDSICLDLFAGSGSLGIEALSNGSKYVYFVDQDKDVLNILKTNLKIIDDNYQVIGLDYQNALKNFYENKTKFDLIFLDPPYKRNYINGILDLIFKYELLNKGGQIICEYDGEDVLSKDFVVLKERKYGSKKIKIFTL